MITDWHATFLKGIVAYHVTALNLIKVTYLNKITK